MKFFRLFACLALFSLGILGMDLRTIPPVSAQQIDAGLQEVASVTNLSSADPRAIAARIINYSLGLLGIIMVVLVLYAGFLWMTAGGDEQKVGQAKRMLRNAVIGLAIVLSSWAITTFVISRLLQATNNAGDGGSGGRSGAGGGAGFGGGGGPSSVFQVRSMTPAGATGIRNLQVRILFSRDVNPATLAGGVRVLRASDRTVVASTLAAEGSLVILTPTAACPAPNTDRKCFEADTEYIIIADRSLRSAGGQSLSCGGFSPACEGRFQSGQLVDTAPPTASITFPLEGQSVSIDDLIRVITQAKDDAGVSMVETFSRGSSIGRDGPASGTAVMDFRGTVPWDTAGMTPGSYPLQSKVFDLDSNSGSSQNISVSLRPAHCFNAKKDGDETGLDCGGACGACGGGACKNNLECKSGLCVNGQCALQPVITGISPGDGRPGTIVTISGVNFGNAPGRVIFFDGKTATVPAACANLGVKMWSDSQVIIQVPAGAQTGPIQLTNSESNLTDTTNDTRGPQVSHFSVNAVARPGLCGARPDRGQPGDVIEFVGADLGEKADKLFFADREISSFQAWGITNVKVNAPVLSPATYEVKARVGAVESNSVQFRLEEKVVTGVPTIDRIDPEQGPIGEYVTVQGRNFGSAVGTVIFKDVKTGESGPADVTFPLACSKNFWQDTSVVVKVPKAIGALGNTAIKAGEYQVMLTRQDRVSSQPLAFRVTTEAPKPGLCAIEPKAGPTEVELTLRGERFGESAGEVSFRSGANRVNAVVDPKLWKDAEIKVKVPKTAVTGPVQVSHEAKVSNGVPYQVQNCNEDAAICGKEKCCPSGICSVNGECPAAPRTGEYAWRTSTGLIPINPEVVEECNEEKPPSPSPWTQRKGGNQVCVNADVVVRFNTKLDPATVNANTVLVRACTGGGENPCSKVVPVVGRNGFPQLASADADTDYLLFRPSATWNPNTTYQVVLTTSIQSDTKVAMKEKADTCGKGNAYCFSFVTNNGKACEVGLVSVTPNAYTAKELSQKISYRASPRAKGDICIQLDGSAMGWTWDTENDGRASITNEKNPNPPGNVLDVQTATAQAETGKDPVRINASLVAQGAKGTGNLFVNFVPPQVEAYGPGCDQACTNAAIWARFNVGMLSERITADNIILKRCTNENCRQFDPPQGLDLSGSPLRLTVLPGTDGNGPRRYLVLEPTRLVNGVVTSYLEPGRFYKVILKSGPQGLLSQTRLPLSGLNDPEGYAWTFRVKTGEGARCSANRVEVTPVEKIETVVGARQSFVAQPIGSPDQCNAEGQPLINDRSYDWTSSNLNVAQFVDGNGMGERAWIDTNPSRAPRCTNRCVNAGADGVAGRVASCGNGTIETTDARYCENGKTKFGEACTLMPAGSRGSEECDLGGNKNGTQSSCSASCLWNPIRTVKQGGTCGNGTIEIGEQCDLKTRCIGGTNPGAVCNAEADCGPGGLCDRVEDRGCSVDCQALGSAVGGSTCGNGDVGDGETCDDGNTQSGDGCSSQCLHEGASLVGALCGNGVLEQGESCEVCQGGLLVSDGQGGTRCALLGQGWNPTLLCHPSSCLHTGSMPQCGDPKNPNCCGNAKVEPGEDCDDGNIVQGDGCSAKCLVEGSSMAYGKPSFCGDAIKGVGEQCEAVKGDGLVDPLQVGQVIGKDKPDNKGLMTSKLRATYDAKIGEATYGLQCGFKEENACPNGFGLTASGCCSVRPSLSQAYPSDGSQDVCRNVLISATFPMAMDESTISPNFVVAKESQAPNCPQGSQPLARLGQSSWWKRVMQRWMNPAQAAVWCVGQVKGKISVKPDGNGTKVTLALDQALETNAKYQVVFLGDPNPAEGKRRGIKTAAGVISNGHLKWEFTTGNRICTINTVSVRDTTLEHPNLFLTADEKHGFEALALSVQNGRAVPLSALPGVYDWQWRPWVSSNPDVFSLQWTGQKETSQNSADISSKQKNGTSLIFASVKITADTVNTPSTQDAAISSSQLVTALLCERPWPSRQSAPFTDQPTKFSTLYCMDHGKAGAEEDYPALVANLVPLTPTDTSRGILRQYLLTYTEREYKQDGIGIRVVLNPMHLSPSAWYKSQGFAGEPKPVQVDGYEAIQDGTTIYVAAVNAEDNNVGAVTSTIYLISHNPNARKETLEIFNQLVTNWTFNVNFKSGAENVCKDAGNKDAYHLTKDGTVVRCSADWECLPYGEKVYCASAKAKLQRDTKRIADFQVMTASLEGAYKQSGKYPVLAGGSYLQTLSTSRWPSWQASFGAALGGRDAPPQDPVNKFLSCGRCSISNTACAANSDCGAGETCVPQFADKNNPIDKGYDPATCWNVISRKYQCPALSKNVPSSVSRIYQYRALNGGSAYELSTELEGPSWKNYDPPLNQQVRRCSNTGTLCGKNDDCKFSNQQGQVISSGTCNAQGGSWRYEGICDGRDYGVDNVCGNGVKGDGEVCEIGQTQLRSDKINGVACSVEQVCNDCKEYVDKPGAVCVPDTQCGNGRIDKDEKCDDGPLNGTYGRCNRQCSNVGAFCGDNQLSLGEICDRGGKNGEYCNTNDQCVVADSCSIDCRGVAPYCGDKIVQRGGNKEQCDGNQEQSASALCKGGDRDGLPCASKNECPGANASCGADDPMLQNDPRYQSCAGIKLCGGGKHNGQECTTPPGIQACLDGGGNCYSTAHKRTCVEPGKQNQCAWNAWSDCEVQTKCGDGTTDPGEECDAGGQNSDTGACTTQCRKNICGDQKVHQGVEECDLGNANGSICTDADYGATCSGCTKQCKFQVSSGGYCGDGRKNGPEQCDGDDFGLDKSGASIKDTLTCKALGFDYAEKIVNGKDLLLCNDKCGFSGCRRCQDAKGNGFIQGQVFDAVYSNQPVPGARVTLYLKGVRINETYTDIHGYYRLTQINDNKECGQYRIVVDFYKDNPCTGTAKSRPQAANQKDVCNGTGPTPIDVDESKYGGYWAYESKVFNLETFAEEKIYLVPKIGPGETVVLFQWKGDMQKDGYRNFFDLRMTVPPNLTMSYCKVGDSNPNYQDPDICKKTLGVCGVNGDESCVDGQYRLTLCLKGLECFRSINRNNLHMRNVYNINYFAYAALHCYNPDGTEVAGCDSPNLSIAMLRYRRVPEVADGFYTGYVTKNQIGRIADALKEISGKVYVVTHDRLYNITPPAQSRDCDWTWIPFQQAASGAVSVVNKYLCANESPPNEAMPFPAIVEKWIGQ